MSCPFVAGVAALLLEANPYLSPAQVKSILTETAYNDEYTAEAGINRFGYGKVDAYNAVREALHQVGVQDHTESLETRYAIFPNPASGSCTLTAQTQSDYVSCAMYDLSGRMVQTAILHSGVNVLSLNNLAPGCYLLRINDDNQIVTRKIIVQ